MYIVTFYSYKGGVGRTMTLVNVAAELAKRGRKVLIVDFDLEAPGISSYDFCERAEKTKGVVEYITEYASTFSPPDIADFVTQCTPSQIDGNGQLWIMPAGRLDAGYRSRFQSINWERLYSEQSGYLMIENLKAQWKEMLDADYVLVDSRTGHTDISGICTRQLPNAVVFTFFPNRQNLSGLRHVVEEVRSERARNDDINLLFAASNTPDIDDEDGILKGNLDNFKKSLKYKEYDLSIIHHYNNLALVDQAIFTLTRPKTRLAREYVALANAIVMGNFDDRDGAIGYLESVEPRYKSEARPNELSILDKRLKTIKLRYAQDGEVLSKLADASLFLGRYSEAITQYQEALEAGYASTSLLRNLAIQYRQIDRRADAAHTLKRLLAREDATDVDVYFAIRGLIDADKHEIGNVISLIRARDVSTLLVIEGLLRTDREMLPYAKELLHEIISRKEIDGKYISAANQAIQLSCIASGEFSEALNSLGPRSAILLSGEISDIFNYAMAEWALKRIPSKDLFHRVAELGGTKNVKGANFKQCMAVSCWMAGDKLLAREWLDKARAQTDLERNDGQEFSCWSYLNESIDTFNKHLDEIGAGIRGEEVTPVFFTTN